MSRAVLQMCRHSEGTLAALHRKDFGSVKQREVLEQTRSGVHPWIRPTVTRQDSQPAEVCWELFIVCLVLYFVVGDSAYRTRLQVPLIILP